MRIKKSKLYGTISIILAVILLLNFIPFPMSMNMKHNELVSLKDDMHKELLSQGMYQCCLEKPCALCLSKTPGHGEGATCSCLEDIMNGVHPCGECIGQILEGNGNKFLSKYFARAIAEKTGNIDAIRQIISEKYGISVEDQL